MAKFGVYLFHNQFDKEYSFCPIPFLEFKFDIHSNSTISPLPIAIAHIN